MADESTNAAEGDPQAAQRDNRDDAEQIEALGEKGRQAIQRERDARRDAEARAARTDAAEHEARRLKGILDKQAAEKAKADEDAAAKRGEFEQLATKREEERNAAMAERDALVAERDQLRAFFDGRVEAALKELPDALKDFDPGPEAPFGQRMAWLEKALKRAGEMTKETDRGNGRDPRATGSAGAANDEAARAANARRYG